MSERIGSVDEYLARLRAELEGSDPALVQDALYDTEDHLRNELAAAGTEARGAHTERLLEAFGSPREVAEAWRQSEARVAQALRPAPHPTRPRRTLMERTFGVFTDPRTYSALVYMLLSLATGVLYFTWVVTGLSISVGTSLLIVGVPIFLLFLASVRALALVEGRVVETLLGVRMPRRVAPEVPGTLWARLKGWLADGRTWLTMLYMLLELPLGVLYFSIAVIGLSLSIAFFVSPFAHFLFGVPLQIGIGFELNPWLYPLCFPIAIVCLFLTLHMARLVGRGHAALARAMLVRG